MTKHNLHLNPLACLICLIVPIFAHADSHTCLNILTCNPLNILQSTPADNIKNSKMEPIDINNVADLLRKLELTQEQNIAIYRIIQAQTPEVNRNRENLEVAQQMLRNMAVNKQFDPSITHRLAQTIADSVANLAVLQAEREYEVFTMLNDAQVHHYYQLTTTEYP